MMRWIRHSPVPLLAAVAVAWSAPAASAQNAPPGNSAVDQYLEAVPTATGSRGVAGSSPKRSVLPAATRKALEGAGGSEGNALADLVDKTAPGTAVETRDRRPAPRQAPTGAAAASRQGTQTRASASSLPPRTPPSGVEGSSGDAVKEALATGGMGWVLPAFLGGSALAAVGFALRRR